jgi:hypothetical protein
MKTSSASASRASSRISHIASVASVSPRGHSIEHYGSSRHDRPPAALICRPPLLRTATPPLSLRAAGEESPPLATPGSLAFARDDKPPRRPGFAITSRHAALVIRSRNSLLSFRAAGEESAPLATPGSLAFARDDDGESFRAAGEESSPLAMPGSLALLGMTRLHPGLASSFRAATPNCHSEPQARNLHRSQRRDPSRSLGMTTGSHSRPKARNLRCAQRRDPSRCSG